MDAISLIKSQHREVKELFAKYEKAYGKDHKQELFTKIAERLAALAAIELKLFYPAIYVGPLQDKLAGAVQQHQAGKRAVDDLLTRDPLNRNYDAKVKVLGDQLGLLFKEEDDLFPALKKQFPPQELLGLGEAMEEMFDGLMGINPNQLPADA